MNVVAILAANCRATAHCFSVYACRVCGRAFIVPQSPLTREFCKCGCECRSITPMNLNFHNLLIRVISLNSDIYGDKLIDYMDSCGICCLREATTESLVEYACENGYFRLPGMSLPG